MITQGADVEIHALSNRGWSLSAIARHVGHDRKTVRAYLRGDREVGVRRRVEVDDPFDRFECYVRQRFADDPHVWATVLFDEIVALGFDRSYQRFTHYVRVRGLRPHCEACAGVKGRAHVDIEHPPGEEIQWDWLELPDTPWGESAYVLVGALAHSSKFRGWFSESMDQPHVVVGIDEVLRRFGGTPRRWRVDRMATVIVPGTDQVQASFAPVAKHYGVGIDPCPARHGNRKGVVEKNIHFLTQRWWRTARVTSLAEAQASLDSFCVRVADARQRGDATVGELAEREPLLALPEHPYPAMVTERRVVAANALVSVWGNRYSVPPGLVGTEVIVRWRLGADTIDIVSPAGVIVVSHRLAPRGSGRTTRLPEHAAALENVVLGAFTTDRPCRRKLNRPPSDAALALAAEIVGDAGREPVIDLGAYQQLIDASHGGVS
jgi:transposase